MYVNDALVWGTEPDGTTPQPTEATKPSDETTDSSENQSSSNSEIVYGDANCDGQVTVADVVAVSAFVVNSTKNSLTAQGEINADVHMVGNGINATDAFTIQQRATDVITELPVS